MSYYEGTWKACTRTVVADGKPHQEIEVTLAAETDIVPMRACYMATASGLLFDTCPQNYGGTTIIFDMDIFISQIPADFPGRSMYDKTTAYGASTTKVPMVGPLEENRKYHMYGGDFTALNAGTKLKCGASGILEQPGDPDGVAMDKYGHVFSLVYAISTTEVVVKYKGLGYWDDTA